MTFVQVIEYETSDLDAVKRIDEEWKDATDGKRTAKRIMLGKHHGDKSRICELVFFDSYEDAMRNNELPETKEYAKKLRDAIDGEPKYLVEGGRPIGILSIGDLAIERDSDSALADISAAEPNT